MTGGFVDIELAKMPLNIIHNAIVFTRVFNRK